MHLGRAATRVDGYIPGRGAQRGGRARVVEERPLAHLYMWETRRVGPASQSMSVNWPASRKISTNWPRLAEAGRAAPRLEAALSLSWCWRGVLPLLEAC